MRFPDTATVLRPAGADEYGNPGTGPHSPAGTAVGFLSGSTFFAPPGADVERGDRLLIAGTTYDVEGDPDVVRSPSREVLTLVTVRPVRK